MWRVLGNASLDESAAVPRQPQRNRPATASAAPASATAVRQDKTIRHPQYSHLGAGADGGAQPHLPSALGSATEKEVASALCGKYRINGIMRKGATGYLYSAVIAPPTEAGGTGHSSKDAAGDHPDSASMGADTKGKVADGVDVGTGREPVVLKVEECAAPKRQMQNEWQASRCHVNYYRYLSCLSIDVFDMFHSALSSCHTRLIWPFASEAVPLSASMFVAILVLTVLQQGRRMPLVSSGD